MGEAEERLAQLLDLANGLLGVGLALIPEERHEQLVELARQLLAVLRALLELLEERLGTAVGAVGSPVQSGCAEPTQPHA